MEVRVVDERTVDIIGNIKSIDDYNEIKRVTQQLASKGAKDMTINIRDSLSMVSSVIGYFMKLINVDTVKVHMNIWDERLYSLLEQLSLVDVFNARQMK